MIGLKYVRTQSTIPRATSIGISNLFIVMHETNSGDNNCARNIDGRYSEACNFLRPFHFELTDISGAGTYPPGQRSYRFAAQGGNQRLFAQLVRRATQRGNLVTFAVLVRDLGLASQQFTNRVSEHVRYPDRKCPTFLQRRLTTEKKMKKCEQHHPTRP